MPEPRPLPPWLELIPASGAPTTTAPTTTSTPEPSQTENLLPWDTMSSTSTPISPAAFAEAIHDLPVETLYAKAAELLNSMQHLRDSNSQMEEFADDEVCKEAIAENEVVIGRIRERVYLCKTEVENRGLRWSGEFWEEEKQKDADGEEVKVNGVARPEEDEVRGEEGAGADEGGDGVHL